MDVFGRACHENIGTGEISSNGKIKLHSGFKYRQNMSKAYAILEIWKEGGIMEKEKAVENIFKETINYEELLEESSNAVYVCDCETYELYYANYNVSKMFRGSKGEVYQGRKCYEYLLGRNSPCEFCKMCEMNEKEYLVRDFAFRDKHLVLKGRLIDWNGRKAHVEYIFDNTHEVEKRNDIKYRYEEKLRLLGAKVQDSVGVFRFDLTTNKCLDVISSHIWLEDLKKCDTISQFLKEFMGYVEASREFTECCQVLTRENLFRLHNQGRHFEKIEFKMLLNDNISEWVSAYINILQNPRTENLEAIVSLVNIDEKKMAEQVIQSMLRSDYESIIVIDAKRNAGRRYTNASNLYKQAYHSKYDANDEKIYEIIPDVADFFQTYIRNSYAGSDVETFIRNYSLGKCIEMLKTREKVTINYSIRDENGVIKSKQDVYSYLNRERQLLCMVHCDVTEMFAEAYHKTEMVENALKLAQKSNNAKTTFLTNVSREMKKPILHVEDAISKVLPNLDEESKSLLLQAMEQTKKLRKMVDDMVEMSEIETGNFILREKRLIIPQLLNNIKNIVEPMAVQKEIELQFNYELADVLMIKTDEGALQQVFVNILKNAVEYSPEGSLVECFVSAERLDNDKALMNVMIKDNGIGMGEEFQRQVYEPFAKEGRKSDADTGLGLGLPLAKSTIESMGGKIWIDSERGCGTMVSLCVPVEALSPLRQDYLMNVDLKMREFDTLDFTQFRALVVKDDEINRRAATIRLQKIGLQVEEARDGEQAVNMVASSPNGYYDIIFMGLHMPVKDGFQATKEIHMLNRADVEVMPFVAMMESMGEKDEEKARELGMDYRWSEPYEMEQLKEILVKEFFVTEYKKWYERKGFTVVK